MYNSRSWRLALAGATLFSGAVLASPPSNMPMHGSMMGAGMAMGHGQGKSCDSDNKHGGTTNDPHMSSMRNVEALDLNAEQLKKVTTLRRELRNNTWDLQRQEIEQREQLSDLYSNEKLDVVAIKAAYEKLFQVKLKIIEHSLNFKQSLSKVLTKEQAEQFQQMMHGSMGGHHGGMMEMGHAMGMK